MEWRDIAAVGGFVLGLLNSWLLLFRKRPFLYVEPFPQVRAINREPGRLRLRIVNPSDLPLQISGLTKFGKNTNFALLQLAPRQYLYREEGASERWFFYRQRGIFRDFIDPNETRYYGLYELEERHWIILIFWWHRNGFFRFRFPMCVILSDRRTLRCASPPARDTKAIRR
jgi:hypothetical protein